jgi:hypothetical protein
MTREATLGVAFLYAKATSAVVGRSIPIAETLYLLYGRVVRQT